MSESIQLDKRNSEWPRITIVTPTFERVEFLRDCIESVLSQNYPNLEYIICDGGSKNSSLKDLIRSYEGRIAWWDSMPDRGHAEAIRRGFDNSTGEIMGWLCSDDYFLPGALKAMGTAFRENPEVDVIYGHMKTVDGDGKTLREVRAIPAIGWAAFTTANIHQPSTLWRRSAYVKAGGNVGGQNWENVVYEPNTDLFCRFIKTGVRFRRLTNFISASRVHAGTVNTLQAAKVKYVSQATFRKHFPLYGIRPVFHMIHFVMRFYQLFALVLQGDFCYVVGWFKQKIR